MILKDEMCLRAPKEPCHLLIPGALIQYKNISPV